MGAGDQGLLGRGTAGPPREDSALAVTAVILFVGWRVGSAGVRPTRRKMGSFGKNRVRDGLGG
ncbi:hypothetical protein FRUB_07124 [Fimbriiglobus ruber]|uniref:Uncharacterized protein n=1 Tax=Fimbriiglobus ruber TaxID=1908690 RepID=A0A225DED1_9BACT|nr:hypothetical protein FRUB_07124 [Fimbriiglobus ruber]